MLWITKGAGAHSHPTSRGIAGRNASVPPFEKTRCPQRVSSALERVIKKQLKANPEKPFTQEAKRGSEATDIMVQ